MSHLSPDQELQFSEEQEDSQFPTSLKIDLTNKALRKALQQRFDQLWQQRANTMNSTGTQKVPNYPEITLINTLLNEGVVNVENLSNEGDFADFLNAYENILQLIKAYEIR